MSSTGPSRGRRLDPATALPLTLAAAAVAVQVAGWDRALCYDRVAILHGEAWRLITGHLVHLGWSHLVWNLAALALIWPLAGRAMGPRAWWTTAVVCGVATSLLLLWRLPTLARYVGLSGLLHGLFAAGSLTWWRAGRREGGYLLLVLAAKLLWEQGFGPLPTTTAMVGATVVVDAHIYGAMAGATSALPLILRSKISSTSRRRHGRFTLRQEEP